MVKRDFTKGELNDILDSFLKFKPVFDKRVSRDGNKWICDQRNYDMDSGHRYIGYDYTYVDAAWGIQNVVFEYHLEDIEYQVNFRKIKDKYSILTVKDASGEKLDFFEIITILTYINRFDRHSDGGVYEHSVEDGTFYNLLCRLEEIRNEL